MVSDTTPTESVRSFGLKVLKPHRRWLMFSIVVIVAASSVGTLSSYTFKLIVDAVEAGQVEEAFFYGLMYPVIVLVIQLLYRLSGYSVARLTVGISKTATDTMLDYLLRHSHTYFSNRFAGAITNKMRNVTGALEQIVPDFIWSQLDTAVTFVVTFVLIALVSLPAAVAFILLLLTLLVLNSAMAGTKARLAKQNAEAGTKLQGAAVDVVSNMSAVRQYVTEDREFEGLQELTSKKYQSGIANWMYTEKMLLINAIAIFVSNFLMFWFLVKGWQVGVVTTGEFILVVALMSRIAGTLLFIGRAVNAMARAFGELREGLEDIYEPYTLTDIPEAKSLTVTEGKIEWSDASFEYENIAVFTEFNLTIPAKQKIGLVGTSGAGKTTFVSLLLRQHELKRGSIFIDGQDIAAVTQASLRQAIAVVPQEPALFHRSIFENIAYGREGATLEEVMAVAKLARAHEFISTLSHGYDTVVGERGVKLSGGQRQRIAIARAMLKNAPILILDEATSALDSESEQYIQEALRELMAGKTVIAIAHRLSTLKEMDRIVVLEKGTVVEDGSHESLKNGAGLYAKLWSHQAGGFLTD